MFYARGMGEEAGVNEERGNVLEIVGACIGRAVSNMMREYGME